MAATMKEIFRKLCWPILQPFEKGDAPYVYKPLNRVILFVFSGLFSFLSVAVLIVAPKDQGWGYLAPVLVFAGVGLVTLVVGALGSERAVSAIWGNK